jgi:hypothetical protein
MSCQHLIKISKPKKPSILSIEEEGVVLELVDFPTIPLRWPASSFVPELAIGFTEEPILILVQLFCGRAIGVAGHRNGGTHSFFYKLQDLELEVEAILGNQNKVAHSNRKTRFYDLIIDPHFTVSDNVPGQCPAFENADGPKPLVNTYFIHALIRSGLRGKFSGDPVFSDRQTVPKIGGQVCQQENGESGKKWVAQALPQQSA